MHLLLLLLSWLQIAVCLQDALHHFQRLMSKTPEDLTYNVPTSRLHAEYDFIVIGAGPGGATVTNRLTEESDWTVLLLEAGGDEMGPTDIPIVAATFQMTNYNWGYRTQPTPGSCLGFVDQRCSWPRGKGMGGSSILNYMLYTRGHPRDYDGWAKMGNTGWGYDDVLPYFLKSENAKGQFAKPPYHAKGGYLNVEDVPYRTPLVHAFVEAGIELGYSAVDYNTRNLIGFSYMQATLRNGSRCSANKAFLRPIRDRKNLHVAKFAQVTRVLIDPISKRVYGVEFHRDGRFWSVRARMEVILSAGAIQTPQLLMLSGVGPQDHLRELNIPVIHHSPGVGQNLQDHIVHVELPFLVNDTVALVQPRLVFDFAAYSRYAENGKGPLTVPGTVEAIAFIRTEVATTPLDYPDIEFIFGSGSIATDSGLVLKRCLGITDEVYDAIYKPANGKDAFFMWPMLMQPASRGWVRLKSKNPFSWPIMSGNYFTDERDVETMVAGIKASIKISKTRAFQRYNATLLGKQIPACRQFQFASDDYWRCSVRHLSTTIYHQSGTSKMGPRTDPMAVVDPELKVYGIKGLRIADASIIPRIPTAHTYAPAIMIGEKAADMIKRTYLRIY